MARIIVCANRKGGVGKSLLSVNLAATLAKDAETVLIDADPQRSAADWIEDSATLPVITAPDLETLERVLEQARNGGRYALVDLPPGMPEPTALALRFADLVIVPILPSPVDIRSAAPLLRGLAEGGVRGVVVLNKVQATTTTTTTARAALEALGVPVAVVSLGFRVAHARAAARRMAVVDSEPSSRAAAEVLALAAEITDRIGRKT